MLRLADNHATSTRVACNCEDRSDGITCNAQSKPPASLAAERSCKFFAPWPALIVSFIISTTR